MCIAIYKDKDLRISKETLQQCFKANPDGAGFMYSSDKDLHIQKGFFTFDDFYEAYLPIEDKKAVIHFRIKTHGTVSENNCHPFHVHKGLGFVHNGIISGFGKDEDSDTAEFNNEVLKPLVQKWGNLALFQPAVKSLVEHRIGYSKLIFLDRHGNVEIYNENKGLWDNGIWYSDSSYTAPKPLPKVDTVPWKTPKDYYNKYEGLRNEKRKQAHEIVKIGDTCNLLYNYFDSATKIRYLKGDIFEVVAVNSDFTVDLMLDDYSKDFKFIYNIPFRTLDFWNASEFDSSYTNPYYNERSI